MCAVLPVNAALIDKAQEGFVNQGGALQGVIGPFTTQKTRGEPAELSLNKRRQFFERLLVPIAPVDEEACYFLWRRVHDVCLENYNLAHPYTGAGVTTLRRRE